MNLARMAGSLVWVAWVAVAVTGCAKDPSGVARAQLGTERADCRPDKGCDPGLMCLSNLCVRPPPADCQAIADQLASMELGNYAEPEIRAPIVATYRANCDKGMVSKEQGACLEHARDKWTAAQCAPLMFPEMRTTTTADCKAINETLRASMARSMGNVDPQSQKMLTTVLGVMQESCEQDSWPDMLKKCISLATDAPDAMGSCNAQIPPGLQQKLSERLQQAMQASAQP